MSSHNCPRCSYLVSPNYPDAYAAYLVDLHSMEAHGEFVLPLDGAEPDDAASDASSSTEGR